MCIHYHPLSSIFFFRAHRTNDLTISKFEKVGPFECDKLEKHCRVGAKCYPTRVPALYAMAKEKFNKKLKTRIRDVTKCKTFKN